MSTNNESFQQLKSCRVDLSLENDVKAIPRRYIKIRFWTEHICAATPAYLTLQVTYPDERTNTESIAHHVYLLDLEFEQLPQVKHS